jgi:hypothetical protein
VASLLKQRETGEEGGGSWYGAGWVPGGGVGGPGDRQRPGTVEVGVSRAAHKQGRGGVVQSGGAHLEERERRAHGSAQEKEKRAGPKGIVNFLFIQIIFK